MPSVASTTLSGMTAARDRLDAHNVANAATVGFRRQQLLHTVRADGGVSTQVTHAPAASEPGEGLVADLVDQLVAKSSFAANIAVFKTNDRMLGALLDSQA